MVAMVDEETYVSRKGDGVLGIGLGSNEAKKPEILNTLKEAGLIDVASLSLSLHSYEQRSRLVMGAPDFSLAKNASEFNMTVPLRRERNALIFEVKNSAYGIQQLYGSEHSGIVDVGTATMGIPHDQFDRLVRYLSRNEGLALNGQGEYTSLC